MEVNNQNNLLNLKTMAKQLYRFAKNKIGFKRPPSLFFSSDETNAKNILGKTAHYEPETMKITVYISGRHPKDILRSMAHELVHHAQNCRGEFKKTLTMGDGYAQNDEHLREMEREAYEVGNLCFRDWEDGIKNTNYSLYETIYRNLDFKGDDHMSIQDWKNGELNVLLMEKWGYSSKETVKEDVDAYLDTSKGGDYKTFEKKLPEDALEEAEEEEIKDNHPQGVEARTKALEKEALDEKQLRSIIRDELRKQLQD